MSDDFLSGLELSRRFYLEAVRPIIERHFPDLPHAAARLGSGSEVLGYDTPRSADHEWGPRLHLFLGDDDTGRYADRIVDLLSQELPKSFLGYPTNFAAGGDDPRIRRMELTGGPVYHRVGVTTFGSFAGPHLGFDPRNPPALLDWLATPWQRLLEFTAGSVFRDDIGVLTATRRDLSWYPTEVDAYILACQWVRVSQEEAFAGRCAEVGDDVGSANVTARIARDLMRICLLLHRRYPPYTKWLGSAFSELPDCGDVGGHLRAAQQATRWAVREHHLATACEAVAHLQNTRRPARSIEPQVQNYYDRPFLVINGGRLAQALRETISHDTLSGLPPVGSVDQWVDSTDVLSDVARCRRAVAAALGLPERTG